MRESDNILVFLHKDGNIEKHTITIPKGNKLPKYIIHAGLYVLKSGNTYTHEKGEIYLTPIHFAFN